MQKIEGHIISGTGRGSKFMSMTVYFSIFARLLNAAPFPGTLNIKLDEQYVNLVNQYFNIGTKFDNLAVNGGTTGGIVVNHFYIKIGGTRSMCVGVRPLLTTHSTDILEIVSQFYLREKLNLNDGSRLILYMTHKM